MTHCIVDIGVCVCLVRWGGWGGGGLCACVCGVLVLVCWLVFTQCKQNKKWPFVIMILIIIKSI